MAYENPTTERSLIGRRQALCNLAGIATAVTGVALVGLGTAQAGTAEAAAAAGADSVTADTVTAFEVERLAQADAASEHELAIVRALIPEDLDMGAWSLEHVYPPRFGAIAVVLRTPAGKAFQVDVLRRDPAIAGVAETKHFSLFVANHGDGSMGTDEYQARGTKVLAHHLRRTERSGSPLPELLSFRQRNRVHPYADYGVLG